MTFRLERIEATQRKRTADSDQREGRLAGRPASDPITFELAPPEAAKFDGNWFSVVIGKNGVGKSRILASIAEAFSVEAGEFSRSRNDSMDLDISYFTNGEHYRLNSNQKGTNRNGKGYPESLFSPSGPSRVICSTMTPFDKFRLSKDVIRDRMPSVSEKEQLSGETYYCYTGFRDSNGRTNFRSSVFRSLKGIFLRSDQSLDRLQKLQDVFFFLGYDPEIELHFNLNSQSRYFSLIEEIRSGNVSDETLKQFAFGSRPSKIQLLFEREPNATELIQDALFHVLNYWEGPRGGSFRVSVNASAEERALLSSAFLLRDLRLITFRDVMLNRTNDQSVINILDASSGEISIVAGMLGVASNIEDNSLILIDEPEISLHPEWQEQYIELLRSTFSPFSGCHFVIATHSPIILSDIGSEGSHVVSLSDNEISKQDAELYAGASVDQLLVTAFGVASSENLFLKQETIKTLNHLVRGSTSDETLFDRLRFLRSARATIGDGTELAKLIDDLLETASDLGKFE